MCRALKFISFFLSFICLIGIAGKPAAAGATPWTVQSVKGDAQYQKAGSAWQPLAGAESVVEGDGIRTSGNGRVVLSRDDESITIAANSSFSVAPAADGMLTTIAQKLGTLMFKVHKRPDRHFEVKTPYLVATVKGTTFTVSVDGGGSAVHVTEGLVQVGDLRGADSLMQWSPFTAEACIPSPLEYLAISPPSSRIDCALNSLFSLLMGASRYAAPEGTSTPKLHPLEDQARTS